MITIRMRMMHFNDMKTFSEAFLNNNFHTGFEFVFDICILIEGVVGGPKDIILWYNFGHCSDWKLL